MTTIQIPVTEVTPGMEIIPEGRKRPVEVGSIDNWNNPNVYLIGHYGQGFNVSAVRAGQTVTQVIR